MAGKRNIYLVGFMGTGKSTIGKELAKLLGRKFLDMDLLLEQRLGFSIAEIFAKYGEKYFRAEERKLAFELAEESDKVVATGGGTVMDPDVLKAFKQQGVVICLLVEKELLIARLGKIEKRPMLQDKPKEEIEELMLKRKAVYDKIPIKVDTTNLTPPQAAKKILDVFKLYQKTLDRLQDQYIWIS